MSLRYSSASAFQLSGVGDFHPSEAGSPLAEGRIADAVLTARPAACSFKILMICSSLNLLLRMSVCRRNGLYPKTAAFKGSRSAGFAVPRRHMTRRIEMENGPCHRQPNDPPSFMPIHKQCRFLRKCCDVVIFVQHLLRK